LNDKGYAAAEAAVAEHVNRGEQVLALDPVFVGSDYPESPDPADWPLLLSSVGERPLGLEAAQLVAVAKWLHSTSGLQVKVDTDGIRTSLIAAVAAALEPSAFTSIDSLHGMRSLQYVLDAPVAFRSAPDLFCLDLYKYFDIDSIAAIAEPTIIRSVESLP
jgi:hypothetical protein